MASTAPVPFFPVRNFGIKRARRATSFDQHVLSCVLSRALDEIDTGEITATDATGLSVSELAEILARSFPAVDIAAFALMKATDPDPCMEEQLLLGLLLAHARPGDPMSISFAKIIARRAMRPAHLWQDLGLLDRAELSRLLASHFPTLAAGNSQNMRWKKYLYRKVCGAEGYSMCAAPNCRDCNDFDSCFGPEQGESHFARTRAGLLGVKYRFARTGQGLPKSRGKLAFWRGLQSGGVKFASIICEGADRALGAIRCWRTRP
ncbi:nitrogen fixation protein NifQ [Mesorhizobium hawassense]|uniref:Nitrogen fixation protein NifQ n=1 Tax=Mesorhizobium hawassense TaxID=1209954 RepID=A0A330HEC8_9HYPH|nr:nitrogen fixation protein NifQ [Mesorhizobium hawassense]